MSKKRRREIPIFEKPIIETHFHMDYLKDLSSAQLLEKSIAHNIEKFITISVSSENIQSAFQLSQDHKLVFCSQGIHPHEAKGWTKECEELIRKNATDSKVVALGEMGLDYYYTKSPKEKQIEVFEKQLDLACELDLPVVIHTRDADEDTITVLKKYSSKLKRKGVIHSFTSSVELARFAISEGFCLGFNGIITFKTAQNVRDVLEETPLNRILIETDAPFLTPDPYRGKENAPYYLPFIAEKIAEVKKLDIDVVLSACYENSERVFFKLKN